MTNAKPLILDPERAMKMALEPRGVAAELARICGISASAVAQWKRCPADRVLTVERISGGRVTRHQLRPDIYPDDLPPHAGAAQPDTDNAPEGGVNWGEIMDRTINSMDADAEGMKAAFAAAVAGLAGDPVAQTRVRPKLEAILRGEAGRVHFIIATGDRPSLVWNEPMADALRAMAEGRLSDGEETLDALLASEAA